MRAQNEEERLLQRERVLQAQKDSALTAASQLHYPQEIKDKIRNAKNEAEILRALTNGRHNL